MSYKTKFLSYSICTVFVVCTFILFQRHCELNGMSCGLHLTHKPSLHHAHKLTYLGNTVNNYTFTSDCNAPFLVWIITSYAGDAAPRSALRRAYTNEELRKFGIKRVFLLGKLTNDAQLKTRVSQNALLNESEKYNDIVQGDFLENYKNLTFKHLMGLSWVLNNCGSVQYIMKMDDDIVVNLYDIIHVLMKESIDSNTIAGYVMKNMIPIRESANKWFVSEKEYSQNIYPEFVSGWLYITTPWVAKKLVDHSQFSNKYFWIDDVFITGILRHDLNIKTLSFNKLYATDYRYLNCCIRGKDKRLKCEYLLGPNGGDVELQVRFSEFGKFCHMNCSLRQKQNSVKNTCITAYKTEQLKGGVAQISPVKIL